jgi:hypothetical protein
VWIALTTALAAALTNYLSYQRTDETLTTYNQGATDLNNVKAWWTALPPEEQAKQDNVTTLVDHTEQVLQSELDGWVQRMTNALAKLRTGQQTAPATAPAPMGAEAAGDQIVGVGETAPDEYAGAGPAETASETAGDEVVSEGETEESTTEESTTDESTTEESTTDESTTDEEAATDEATAGDEETTEESEPPGG